MIIYCDQLYQNPVQTLVAFDDVEVKEVFDRIEELRHQYILIGYVRYEAKDVWLGKPVKSDLPLVYMQVFQHGENYVPNEPMEIDLEPVPAISYHRYHQDLSKIKSRLHCGDTYQVNYTYDSFVYTNHSAREVYESILPFQKTPYNAFFSNEYEEILSFSPELFFEWEGQKIRTKPMKGTIKRSADAQEDAALKLWLSKDEKNRSENVMIVDLLRNDLGRIAVPNSVQVTELFGVETHPTLHQMTSEIVATVSRDTGLFDLFTALYPCGSITGAPKVSTMDIIEEIEFGPRGVYCGAIAYMTPKKSTFSVPIRILQRAKNEEAYRYRVGGGIVWDSDIASEWFETQVKTRLLKNHARLVETLLVKDGVAVEAQAHWQRMKSSADILGYRWNDDIECLYPTQDGMWRVLLSKSGRVEQEYIAMHPASTNVVRISYEPVFSSEIALRHKTTYRPWYQAAMVKIKQGEVYDELFVNERGEITEGARTNIFAEIDGVLYTPPVSCGLLPGVLRKSLLESGSCQERILTLDDLNRATNLFCGNSVRGLVPVVLEK